MNDMEGFNSPACTWKWYRTRLGPGKAVQILIEGIEHRLCAKHNSEHMNGKEGME